VEVTDGVRLLLTPGHTPGGQTVLVDTVEGVYAIPGDNVFLYDSNTEMASNKASRQSWARLIQKVYEIDPLICPKCSLKMRIVAVITDPSEVSTILECLKRNNAPPFDKVVAKVS